MRIALVLPMLLLGACAHSASPQSAAGASPLGLPAAQVSHAAVEEARSLLLPGPGGERIRIPDVLRVPEDYRLIVLDGHLSLVRDTGRTQVDPSLQPALLPQELAAEVASARESSARMDSALRSVMQRSQELSDRAADLEAEAKRLSMQLAPPAAQGHPPEPGTHPASQDAPPSEAPKP